MQNRNSLFSTKHDGRKIKSFVMDIDNKEFIFESGTFKNMVFSGSFHGEYDLFFIVVGGDRFYNIKEVKCFEFEKNIKAG